VGDWKLIATGKDGPWELYDLGKDRGEQHDLAAAQPERVQKLSAMWSQQDAEYARTRESAPPTAKVRIVA
jgi:arylsulfatase A-like enzyme